MSREEYHVPTGSPTFAVGGAGGSGTGSGANYSGQTGGAGDGSGPAINYLCGECNSKVPLKRGDPIRCKECGHRVLYKERTKRMVQFEAR
ncbi:MAG: DNA-directed RNA polymerase core subunit rpc10 [Thelocarpon superellum]|nr:MAG: DNA-directed RNA polymerase core subunit rpc10 [Thelocarpon superellum]